MKYLILLAMFSSPATADVVNGYFKSDGSYVMPYVRSNANSITEDNYGERDTTMPNVGITDQSEITDQLLDNAINGVAE
jgi:hypothetical protein